MDAQNEFPCKEITFDAFLHIQRQMILSELNRHYAGEYYGREVSNFDLGQYWALCGAAEWFRREFGKRIMKR